MAIKYTPRQLFRHVIEALQKDNGGPPFLFSLEQMDRCIELLRKFQLAGYFSEEQDPDDLDSDFWILAAGEETETEKRFSKLPSEWEELNNLLNTIFEQM